MKVVPVASEPRVFLFLQGPASSLFIKIGQRLTQAGHRCYRINLNVGDWLFWNGKGTKSYRGRSENWPIYLAWFFDAYGVTDILLLGEERPYHKVAVDMAKERSIAVTVIEMGYLRPDWVTVERDGISSNSHFPNDPVAIRRAGRDISTPDFGVIYPQSFTMEALLDLAYNLPNVFFAWLFPHYRRHGLFHPLKEYAGWLRRLVSSRFEKARAEKLIGQLKSDGSRYFVYPLQLETDYQLRVHSPYSSQFEAIEDVLSSFANHAWPDTQLVIKAHPLDNGLTDWRARINALTSRLGLMQRVHYIDHGDLSSLMEGTDGIVAVNSTAVLHGLRTGIPAKVLGCAVYDIEGMTHQGSLDSFWCNPARPDGELTRDFYKLLAEAIHVRGNFCSRQGTDAAASAIASRLLECRVNFPGGDCGHTPRKRPNKFQVRSDVSNLAHKATKGC